MKTYEQIVRDVLTELKDEPGFLLWDADDAAALSSNDLDGAAGVVYTALHEQAERIVEALEAEGWETSPANPPYDWRKWMERVLQRPAVVDRLNERFPVPSPARVEAEGY